MSIYSDRQQSEFDRIQRAYDRQEPPEERVSKTCACCGESIMEGEACYKIGEDYYCEECVTRTYAPEVQGYDDFRE